MKSLRCLFGLHTWRDCNPRCVNCNKTRVVPDELHVWEGCKCKICNKRRDVNDINHVWMGCICSKCGLAKKQVPETEHVWSPCGVCKKCYAEITNYRKQSVVKHEWIYSPGRGVRVQGVPYYISRSCKWCGKIEYEGPFIIK